MSEGSRFLDFARNDKTQNFLLRYFHRAEVYLWFQLIPGHSKLWGEVALRACQTSSQRSTRRSWQLRRQWLRPGSKIAP